MSWLFEHPWLVALIGAIIVTSLTGLHLYWTDQENHKKWQMTMAYVKYHAEQDGTAPQAMPPAPVPSTTPMALSRAFIVSFVVFYVLLLAAEPATATNGAPRAAAAITGGDITEEVLRHVIHADPDF